MPRRILVIAFALLPSIWAVWQAGGMPHLGAFHDDGVYVGTARSIADGKGPRIESFPGEPFQVKYPPLFPLYLAAGVRAEWSLTLLVWLPLPFLLYQVWRWRRDSAIVILLGWNVYSVLFAGVALTEVFSTALLVWSLRWMEQERVRGAALVAGAAYLTRTAMIALPAAALLWLAWKRRWRDAGIYLALFAPFALGWSAYSMLHAPANAGGEAAYYLSYGTYFRDNMGADILPAVLSINATAVLQSLGGLLFFNMGDSFWEGNFARLLFLAAGAGLARQARRSGAGVYEVYAVLSLGLLTVWNFLPNERFVYPLLPLLLVGLATEARHFRDLLKVTWRKQRAATVILGTLAAMGACWALERGVTAAWSGPRNTPAQYRQRAATREEAYAWIRAHMPAGSNFVVYDDSALRRATGMHGFRLHCPTRLMYRNDLPAIRACFENAVQVMRNEGAPNLLIAREDYEQELGPEDREKIRAKLMADPELVTVFDNSNYVIRVLRPAP